MNRTWQILLSISAALLVVTVGMYVVASLFGVPLSKLISEPATYTDSSFYTGIFSSLGIMLWSAATAFCFLGAALLRDTPRASRFLLLSGVCGALLALDNLLLLHDRVIPRYLHIHENRVYLIYLLLVGAFLVSFARYILSTRDYPLLGFSLLLLFLSVAMGALLPYSDQMLYIKGSFKLAGIAFWLAYYSVTVFRWLDNRALVAEKPQKHWASRPVNPGQP